LGVKPKRPMPAMLADGGMIAATVEEFAEDAPVEDGRAHSPARSERAF